MERRFAQNVQMFQIYMARTQNKHASKKKNSNEKMQLEGKNQKHSREK